MLCPVCNEEMIILEVDEVEVDHCVACGGIWLDPGELDLLVEMSGAEPGPLSRLVEGGGGKKPSQKRRCPVCRREMLEVVVEGPTSAVRRIGVDRCRHGHGLWLDDQELGPLIESAGGAAETDALARLCGRMLRSERSETRGGGSDVGTDSGE